MIYKTNITKLYVFSALFLLVSVVGMFHEFYLIPLLPFALGLVLLAFLSLRQLMLIIAFCIPLSIELIYFFPDAPIGMSIPTEPILFGVMGIFFLKLITERRFDKRVLSHPITITIYIYIAWLCITTISSEMPIISIKYILVRLWFLVNFYFLITQLVRDRAYISKYIWAYSIGMFIVVVYTLVQHAQFGFSQSDGYHVMEPFFRDHTSYGAVLAMLLPAVLGLLLVGNMSVNQQVMYGVVLSVFLAGVIFSYTRAAWGSLFGVVIIWLIAILKIKFRSLVFVGFLGLIMIAPLTHEIIHGFSKNEEVSSSDFSSHLRSMTNISTDVSNVERINRWRSAIEMFKERPVLGWGPGTYMFVYAPFQHSKDRNVMSTNTGDLGNAHSEYLGLLSEAGVIGMLSFILIIIVTLTVGFTLYSRTRDSYIKTMSLYLLLALITYYAHGVLNNFLDSDKVASLFWAFTAILVAFDIEDKEAEKNIEQNSIKT